MAPSPFDWKAKVKGRTEGAFGVGDQGIVDNLEPAPAFELGQAG